MSSTKKTKLNQPDKKVADRARAIRKRLTRLGITRAPYRIDNAQTGRVSTGNSPNSDTHVAHLPKRR